MLKDKGLLEYRNLFSPNGYKKNENLIVKYFQLKLKIMKIYCNVCKKYRKSKKTKILLIFQKTLSLSIVSI